MNRIKIEKIKWTNMDIIIEIIGQLLLFSLWLFVLSNYADIPEKIPVHYSGLKADAYGHKSSIFIILGLVTLLYIGISILERFPHLYNYPVTITKQNIVKMYTLGTRMLRAIKIVTTLILGFGIFNKVSSIYRNIDKITPYFFVFTFVSLIGTTIYFVLKMNNLEK